MYTVIVRVRMCCQSVLWYNNGYYHYIIVQMKNECWSIMMMMILFHSHIIIQFSDIYDVITFQLSFHAYWPNTSVTWLQDTIVIRPSLKFKPCTWVVSPPLKPQLCGFLFKSFIRQATTWPTTCAKPLQHSEILGNSKWDWH